MGGSNIFQEAGPTFFKAGWGPNANFYINLYSELVIFQVVHNPIFPSGSAHDMVHHPAASLHTGACS